ncbi:MAG: hypothetical protein AMXMBFR74_26650 [Parvibaculum sp.]
MDEPEAAGAENHTRKDVADDGGLAEPHQGKAATECNDDQQRDGIQRENVVHREGPRRAGKSAGAMITQGGRPRKGPVRGISQGPLFIFGKAVSAAE